MNPSPTPIGVTEAELVVKDVAPRITPKDLDPISEAGGGGMRELLIALCIAVGGAGLISIWGDYKAMAQRDACIKAGYLWHHGNRMCVKEVKL